MHLVSDMAERIEEAHRLVRRFIGTAWERAAMAHLAAQVEAARRDQDPVASKARENAPVQAEPCGRLAITDREQRSV